MPAFKKIFRQMFSRKQDFPGVVISHPPEEWIDSKARDFALIEELERRAGIREFLRRRGFVKREYRVKLLGLYPDLDWHGDFGKWKKMEPELLPLKSLEDAQKWSGTVDNLYTSSVMLKARVEETGSPRTLVCHDMAGGYLDDRFIQGVKKTDCYRFYHWNYIDTFVYFSHNLITIPPPCWINAAHKHGVSVLGTFITEWEDGQKICEEFLSSEVVYKSLADKLIKIAKHYGFEGWLLNIENKIEEKQIPALQSFVEYLNESMAADLPGSIIIWYDSVIESGELKWQNELNEKNKLFWDACHSIFLNYNWTEENLKKSAEIADKSESRYNVYVGVDVFGRGCLGGGGFNSKEALMMIRKYRLSAAIFAQGWVYEHLDKENFFQNENRFWYLLRDLCTLNTISGKSFATSFCQGYGNKYFLNGEEVSSSKWTNLNLQQLQPDFECLNGQFISTRFETKETVDCNVDVQKESYTQESPKKRKLSVGDMVVTDTSFSEAPEITMNEQANATVIVNSTCVVEAEFKADGKLNPESTASDGTATKLEEQDTEDGFSSPLEVSTEDGYVGSCCLKFHLSSAEHNCDEVVYRLFKYRMPLDSDLLVSYSYKSGPHTPPHHLEFDISDKVHQRRKTILCGNDLTVDGLQISCIPEENVHEHLFLYSHCMPESGGTGWKSRYYLISVGDLKDCEIHVVEEIKLRFENLKTIRQPCDFLLGQIQVIPADNLKQKPCKPQNIEVHDINISSSSLSCMVRWDKDACVDMCTDYFNIYVTFNDSNEWTMIGHAVMNSYVLTGISVPPEAKSLNVLVQPVYCNGFSMPKTCCDCKTCVL